MDVWVEHEVEGGEFPDQRLKSRLGKLLGELGRRIGNTVPTACQDWAATKAAYRFFSNARVDEQIILAGHFAATKARFAETQGSILVLHDTTEFTFKREKPEAIGQTRLISFHHRRPYTVCGLLMHSSLVLPPRGYRWGWRPSSFGPGRSSRGPMRSRRKSKPPAFRSNRRRASAGWRT